MKTILQTAQYEIVQTGWYDAETDIKTVRQQVFIIEQGISPDLEWELRDHSCMHVLAYCKDNTPIGTGRLLSTGLIGRLAVLPTWRGKNIGSSLLQTLIDIARQSKIERPYLYAQTHPLSFYLKFGFQPTGEIIYQAGLPHQLMCLKNWPS